MEGLFFLLPKPNSLVCSESPSFPIFSLSWCSYATYIYLEPSFVLDAFHPLLNLWTSYCSLVCFSLAHFIVRFFGIPTSSSPIHYLRQSNMTAAPDTSVEMSSISQDVMDTLSDLLAALDMTKHLLYFKRLDYFDTMPLPWLCFYLFVVFPLLDLSVQVLMVSPQFLFSSLST